MKKTIKTLLSLIIIAFMFFAVSQSNSISVHAKADTAEQLTASAKLSKTTFTYNRKSQTPKVKVKNSKGKPLKEGTHYKVKYPKEPIKVGTYNITVTYKGDYKGKETLSYKIVPRAVKELTFEQGTEKFWRPNDWIRPPVPDPYIWVEEEIVGVNLSWKKANGVTGYRVYVQKNNKWKKIADTSEPKYTVKNLTSGKVYKFAVKAFKIIEDETYFSNTYTTINAASKPTETQLKVKLKGNKLHISWDKKSCSGYYLYISDGSWEGEQRINIKDSTTTTYIYKYPNYSYYVWLKIKTYASTDNGKIFSNTTSNYAEMEPTVTETDKGIKIKPIESKEARAILDKWRYDVDYTGEYLRYSVKQYFEGKSANGKHVVVYSHSYDGWSGIDIAGAIYDGAGKKLICERCGKVEGSGDNMCYGQCKISLGQVGDSKDI